MNGTKRLATILGLVCLATAVCSCVYDDGPSKRSSGNVELSVGPLKEGEKVLSPSIYLDGRFIGTASPSKPILYLKRGNYDMRFELEGHEPQEHTLRVLSRGNMQYLRVELKKRKVPAD